MAYNFVLINNVNNELKQFVKVSEHSIIAEKNKLKKYEETTVLILETNSGIDNIADELLTLNKIPEDVDVVQYMVNHRKQMMEKIIKAYTKNCINNNILEPAQATNPLKMTYGEIRVIDQVMNMVNNYYDSIYARYTNLDIEKTLPEYENDELVQLKYNAYKKIKKNTGMESIMASYKKSKCDTFAEYCMEATGKYISEYNQDVVNHLQKKDNNIDPKRVDLDELNLNPKNVANVKTKIPMMYAKLLTSYYSRSAAERFFSYFPFINPTAKEERKAIHFIQVNMEYTCYAQINEDALEKLADKEIAKERNDFYQKKLDEIGVPVEEEQKVPIEAYEVNANEEVAPEIDDMVVNEIITKNMFRY